VAQDETNRIESERKMSEINDELVKASSKAAKVELADGVLHNVGNIVNSINVSTNSIKKQVEQLSVSKLDRVCQLISEHESDFGDFVQSNAQGQKIPSYILKVNEALAVEKCSVDEELQDLVKNVNHIKAVITSQQSAAKSNSTKQLLTPEELLSDAVTANKANLANHDVEISEEIDQEIPAFYSDKHKILQILVNLIKNANDALVENQSTNPQITTRVRHVDDCVVFEVADNGIGIPPEKIGQIFQHGFTTKQTGHGFGLHSSEKAATDLGGKLTVSSEGIGAGATFRLSIPTSEEPNEKSNPEVGVSSHSNNKTLVGAKR
jgi:signal transduction histidine kinase